MFVYHHSWGIMLGMFVFWLLALGGGASLLAKLLPETANRPDSDTEREVTE